MDTEELHRQHRPHNPALSEAAADKVSGRADGRRFAKTPQSPEELAMVRLGVQRFHESRKARPGMGSRLSAAGRGVSRFMANIEAWLAYMAASHTRSYGAAYAVLLQESVDACGLDVVALIAGRTIMEGASIGASAASVSLHTSRAVETETRAKLFRERNPYMFRTAAELRLLKPVGGVSGEISRLIRQGRLSKDSAFLQSFRWSTEARASLGLVLLHLFLEATGFIQIDPIRERGRRHAINTVVLSESYKAWQGDFEERNSLLRPALLPITELPKSWEPGQPDIGGYHSPFITLVKSGSAEEIYDQSDLYSWTYPQVLKSLNRLQATAWEINSKTYEFLDTLSKYPDAFTHLPEAVLPPQPEPYPQPALGESGRSLRYRRSRYFLLNQLSASRRVRQTRVYETIKTVKDYNAPFYFPCNLDYRSRLYVAASGLFSPQGNDLARGNLRFANGHELTPEGLVELKLHTANCWGLDKQTLDVRSHWVDDNIDAILECGESLKNSLWWTKAEEPWQFAAACTDLFHARNTGESKCLCWADATASGFQFLALLTGDQRLAELTNLVPGSERKDLYEFVLSKVYPEVLAQLGQYPNLHFCVARGITRDLIKPVVMAVPYGISVIGMSEILSQDLLRWLRTSANQTDDLDKYLDGAARLTTIIYRTMEREFPLVFEFMRTIKAGAIARLREGHRLEWTTPTGFPWRQGIPKTQATIIRPTLGPSQRIWTEVAVEEEGTLDVKRNQSATPANFIHSLDAAVMQMAISRMPEGAPVASVHDCIGTHANYMAEFKRHYKESLRDVFQSNPLESWFAANGLKLQDFTDKLDPLSKKLVDDIPSSRYCIS